MDPADSDPEAAAASRLSRSTLGAHNKTSAKKSSKSNFVSAWVSSQAQKEGDDEVKMKAECKIPAIIVTEVDEECAEQTQLVPAQYELAVSSETIVTQAEAVLPKPRSMSVDTPTLTAKTLKLTPSKDKVGPRQQAGGLHPTASSRDRSGRRLSIYPNILDQPIMEESTEDLEAFEDEKCELQQPHQAKREICIDQPLTLSSSFGASKARQRAKSFPCDAPINALPMLELPQHVQDQHKESQSTTTQEDLEVKKTGKDLKDASLATGLGKFVQVTIMAKKWKKRSVDGLPDTEASRRESLQERQRKRPFTEVPRVLKLDLMEEAYPIVQKTYNTYKSYLGPRHKLTLLAEKHLKKLEMELD